MGGRLRLDALSTGHLVGSKNLTGMRFRKFLGALCLGLPAAVTAHFLTFGNAHTLGGATHLALIDATVVAVCASVLALCLGAVYFAAATREGSILASRLDRLVPSALTLAVAATSWFMVIERAEESHATPLALAAIAVICVALLFRFAICAALRILARAALHIFSASFRARQPERFDPVTRAHPSYKRPQLALSRFSRPPPRFA